MICLITTQKKWAEVSGTQSPVKFHSKKSNQPRWIRKGRAPNHPEAPAVSIARSVRAVGKASPALVGSHANMRESNATRDVTSLLARSGMAMKVKRDYLVSCHSFNSMFCFVLVFHKGCDQSKFSGKLPIYELLGSLSCRSRFR